MVMPAAQVNTFKWLFKIEYFVTAITVENMHHDDKFWRQAGNDHGNIKVHDMKVACEHPKPVSNKWTEVSTTNTKANIFWGVV